MVAFLAARPQPDDGRHGRAAPSGERPRSRRRVPTALRVEFRREVLVPVDRVRRQRVVSAGPRRGRTGRPPSHAHVCRSPPCQEPRALRGEPMASPEPAPGADKRDCIRLGRACASKHVARDDSDKRNTMNMDLTPPSREARGASCSTKTSAVPSERALSARRCGLCGSARRAHQGGDVRGDERVHQQSDRAV